jgi:uncharacterized membrane protein
MEPTRRYDEPSTPAVFRRITAGMSLSEAAYRRGLELTGAPPAAAAWVQGIGRFLFAVGVMLILAGVAAFFASNWDGLHRLAKLAVIEAGIVVCAALTAWRGIDSSIGRAGLFAAAFLVGILFAVYGQAYQTGADPYGLFLVWALLIVGWAIIGRQAALWLLLLMLLNLSLILYWAQVLRPGGLGILSGLLGPLMGLLAAVTDSELAGLVFVLNAGSLLIWEWFAARGVGWMAGRWVPRVLSILALGVVVTGTLFYLFDIRFGSNEGWLLVSGPVCFAGFAAASFWYYRTKVLDLFILTATLLGTIVVITSLLGRTLGGGGFEVALILAVLLIGQTAGAAFWLRHVTRRWEES